MLRIKYITIKNERFLFFIYTNVPIYQLIAKTMFPKTFGIKMLAN